MCQPVYPQEAHNILSGDRFFEGLEKVAQIQGIYMPDLQSYVVCHGLARGYTMRQATTAWALVEPRCQELVAARPITATKILEGSGQTQGLNLTPRGGQRPAEPAQSDQPSDL